MGHLVWVRSIDAEGVLMHAFAVEALPTECWQQRGVDVEHRPAVRSHQFHWNQLREVKSCDEGIPRQNLAEGCASVDKSQKA